MHQIKQPSRLRTMLFSVLLQGRITLFHLRCLGLALFLALARIWWAFIPFAQRLDSELQHARSRLAKVLKRSVRLVDAIALLFSLSLPFGKRILCSIHVFQSLATKSRKLQLACFWTNFINKTLLGFSPVAPRESWDRAFVIELGTCCPTCKVSGGY